VGAILNLDVKAYYRQTIGREVRIIRAVGGVSPDEALKHLNYEYTKRFIESVPTLYRKCSW